MKKLRFHNEVLTLASKALANGAVRVSFGLVRWDISGNCRNPHWAAFHGVPSPQPGERKIVVTRKSPAPMTVELATRCRKCDMCRQQKARLWRARASAEIGAAHRTWFGTFTQSPDVHYRDRCEIAGRYAQRENDFDLLPASEQFRLRADKMGREITLMLKRLRSATGVRFRYLLVAEAHKSGMPHFHVLLHEPTEDTIKVRELEEQWRRGFSKWKLVLDVKPAAYVSKYISKSSMSRVRASIDYGSPEPQPLRIARRDTLTPKLKSIGTVQPEVR